MMLPYFPLLADALTNTANSVGVTSAINVGVSGTVLTILIRKYKDEIDYLRDQLARHDTELVAERVEKRELNEGIRKDVVPALSEVARILPVVIDRLTK